MTAFCVFVRSTSLKEEKKENTYHPNNSERNGLRHYPIFL